MEITNFLNFTGLNFAVGASSLLIVFWLNNYRIHSISKLLISLFILFCSQIILIEILLGIFGLLTYANISIATYSVFTVIAILLGKKVIKNLEFETKIRDYPNFFVVLVLFGPIVFLLFAKFFNAALQIPLEYDSIAYHLPFIAQWLQSGSLNDVYYSAFAGPISYYPSNYELLDLWTFLPFANDFFANFLNFPLFAILGIVIWRILKNFDIDQNTAIIGTAIPFYMPIFLHQAGLPLVDLFFALTFAISFYFLQEIYLTKDERYSDFLLFGLSLGLFIGTKYLGLVYGALVVFLLILISFYKFRRKKVKILKVGIITIAGVLLTGGFFYIRNWIDSGNPLFPVNVNFLGFNIFEGYRGINENLQSTSILANLHLDGKFAEYRRMFFYIASPYGLISIVIPFILLAFVIVKVFLQKLTKKINENKNILIPISLALLGALFFYFYIKAPYTDKDLPQNIRYSMPFLLVGTFSVAYLTSKIKIIKPIFYLVTSMIFTFTLLFCIVNPPEFILYGDRLLIDYSILWNYKEYLAIAVLSLVALFFLLQAVFSPFRSKKIKISAILILLIISYSLNFQFLSFAFSEREKLTDYWSDFWFAGDQAISDFMQASHWLNKNAPTASIAYTGFNFHYHLYGRSFQRDVDYVNINECEDCRYFDYRNSESSIRRDPDYANWLNNLETYGKQYLIVNPLSTKGVRSYEFEWANKNSNNFEQVFNVNDVYIYKISYD